MLEMAARIHFAAGVSLLYEDWLAYSADPHLRALLEIYAHVAWIQGKGGLRLRLTPGGRAVCMELGMARALQAEMQSLGFTTPLSYDAASLGAVDAWVAGLQRIHEEDGCSCQGAGRNYGQVEPALKAMASADPAVRVPDAVWLHGFWKKASRVTHYSGLERMIKVSPSSRKIAPADPWQRVGTFQTLIVTYGWIVEWVMEFFSPADARALHDSLRDLLDDPAVKAAARTAPAGPPASASPSGSDAG
jgi:hypothetical protein